MPIDPNQVQPMKGLGRATSLSNNEGWMDRIMNALVGDAGRGQSLGGKALTGLDQLMYGHSQEPGPHGQMNLSMMPMGPKGLRGAGAALDIGEDGGLFNNGVKIMDEAHVGQNFNTPARPNGPWNYMNQNKSQGPLAWGDNMVDTAGGSTMPAASAPAGSRNHMASGIPDEAIRALKEEAMNRFNKQTANVPLGELLKVNKLR